MSKIQPVPIAVELTPLIEAICKKAGVPGLAVGIIQNGKIVYESYYGYRDVESALAPDRDTLFHVASLTKAMTATAIGILVDRGQLDWSTPVHDILPEMSRDTNIYAAKLTVIDILSHRTGKAWADALYLGSNNNILLPKSEAIRTFDYLPQVTPVRSQYSYNNHAYNIAGLVIEKVSGMSWEDFMTKNIFKSLGMARTFTRQPQDENVTVLYNILTDKTPWRIPFCNLTTARELAVSPLKPVVNCNTRMESHTSQIDSEAPTHDILREIITIIQPHIARPVDTLLEQTYALGWNRTQLPGSLDFGWNQELLQPFPLFGKEFPGKLAIWHGGNMPGTTSALCLLPESQIGVVVLQNSLGLCDVADWICQPSIDTVMVGNPTKDYLSYVSTCVDRAVLRMEKVQKQLNEQQIHGTKPQPLATYAGRYFNQIKNWFIDILVKDDNIYLEFLGRGDERFQMHHYHYDTFTWNMSYDETVKRAQYIRSYQYYRIMFEREKSREGMWQLRWHHDKTVKDGELFCQESPR
ncbi:unnamed protein product [Clonostachys rosea]|uniref:Beta-lactamase-related domain-containing protein n=1 Tax=Bionectria ochroleuca TaxID=29856 RepID=A0ABY6UKW9_BIOOC|nr:unnamed protein product [Clonostachys rosea]